MDEEYLDMSPEEFQELLTEFLTESDNHLQVLNEKLLIAEDSIKNGIEMSDSDLNAMFRAAHTIKGTAGFINLKRIVKLTHEMETILQRVKEREMPLTGHIIDVLFKAFDTLEMLFSGLRENGVEEGDIEASVQIIREVLDGQSAPPKKEAQQKKEPVPPVVTPEIVTPSEEPLLSAAEKKEESQVNEKYLQQFIVDAEENVETFNAVLMNLESEKNNVALVNDLFRCMHTIKGSSGIVNAIEVQSVAHAMENVLSHLRETQTLPNEECFSLLFEGIDMVRALVEVLRTGEASGVDSKPLCEKLNVLYKKGAASIGVKPTATKPVLNDDDFDITSLSKESQVKLLGALKEDKDFFEIECLIAQEIPAKSMKVLLIEERMAKGGILIKCLPASMEITEEPHEALNVRVYFCSSMNEKEIRSLLSLDGVMVKSIERLDVSEILTQENEKKEERDMERKAHDEVAEKATSREEVEPNDEAASETGAAKKGDSQQKSTQAQKAPSIEISTIRVDSHKIDNLMNLSGELVITRARFSQLVNQFNAVISTQKDLLNSYAEVKDLHGTLKKEIKGHMGKDADAGTRKLAKMVDELDRSIQGVDQKILLTNNVSLILTLDEVTSALGKIASDIQSGVMQTRMIPIEGIFTRFKRVVRDISKSLNKNVNLRIEGEETELDKKIVDSLGDPLTHMIRNACDHGIEDKETRLKAGKPEEGTVLLRASHKGNSFCIEIGDDGKGLDAEKITQSAVKKQIITQEQADKMTEKEKLHLVFAPGFSTAEKVTGISGRGVGMDVVKNMITSVNGVVDIETEVGKGTSFVLKIPLTLAIIQALLVVIGDETFAFPLETVIEIIKVSDQEIYSIDGTDTVKLRGHALSVVELEKIIKIGGPDRSNQTSKKVVVITNGENQVGVVVDSLIGEDEIVIKSLTDHFAGVVGITGASILGDGRIALILDPFSIIRETNR
jgi:two-component system chemotaxis sensor kinase CheA